MSTDVVVRRAVLSSPRRAGGGARRRREIWLAHLLLAPAVLLMAGEEYSYVSSTLMKQVFELDGRVEGLIPEIVESRMRQKKI